MMKTVPRKPFGSRLLKETVSGRSKVHQERLNSGDSSDVDADGDGLMIHSTCALDMTTIWIQIWTGYLR